LFTSDEEIKNLSYTNYKLYKKNQKAYGFYLGLFKEYYPEIEYNQDAIDKLNQGIYPLIKPKGTPLKQRIFNKLNKSVLRT